MRAKKRDFNLCVCELRFDQHYKGVKPCVGDIKEIAGVRLCSRHRDLVEAIVRDANRERGRHPVHHGRGVAA